MVLVKTSRVSVGAGGLEEGKVCSVAWQRQHMHHQQRSTRTSIKMAAQGGEALPVVELRPFTKRVWRREKSLPNFSEQPTAKADSGTDSSRNGGIPPPPNIGQFLRELRDERRMKDASGRHSVDSPHRLPLKIHPKAEFTFDGDTLAEHRQDLIPSFVSRQERSKTMLAEDGGIPTASAVGVVGGSNNSGEETADGLGVQDPPGGLVRESSNLMSAYTRDKPLHHQNVCLMGDKIDVTHPGRRHLAYLNPFPLYRQKQAWPMTRLENSPTTLSPHQRVNVSFLARDGRAFPTVSRDYFPSQDLVLAGSLLQNVSRVQQPYSTQRQISPHKFHQKLGAAQDSFLALNRNGAPTVVEQNLSFDLEVRLERCRRERSFAAVSEINVPTPGQYLSYDSQLTRGETILMKAREANKSQDRRRMVHKKNGLDRSLVTLPSFVQHRNAFRGGVDDSNTSMKPQQGDSEMISLGETTEGSGRRADSSRPFSQNMTPRAQQQPAKDGTPKTSAKESHRVAFLDTDPIENIDDMDSLVESTDEYQRPLSDTAATETVHMRNDQTPMSADNRARLLPRYDAYLEVIQTGREHTAQRQRIESSSKDLPFFQDPSVLHGAQQTMQMVPDAVAMNRGGGTSNSSSFDQSALQSMLGSPGPLQNESQGTDAHQRGKKSADSLSANRSPPDPTQSVEINKDFIVGDSGQSERIQQNTDHQVSPQTSEQHTKDIKKPELYSVGSDMPSSVRPESRKDTDDHSSRSEPVTQEISTKEGKGSIPHPNDAQDVLRVSHLRANNPVVSDVPLNTAKDHQTMPEIPIPAADDRTAQKGSQDMNRNVSTDNNEAVVSVSSMDDNSMSSEQKNTNKKPFSEFSDINTKIESIFETDQTAARSTRPHDKDTKEDLVSAQKAESQGTIKASSSSDSLKSLSQSRQSPSPNRPVSREHLDSSMIKPRSNIGSANSGSTINANSNVDNNDIANNNSDNTGSVNINSGSVINTSAKIGSANNNANSDNTTKGDSDTDAQTGVETMVTVTMDPEECDDASKTFLTTANVDSQDWKDMVAV